MIRPASHAGSWYSADPVTLKKQLSSWFAKTPEFKKGARILIGPHAGYAYCGERLSETYSVWDLSKAKRVFMLGPSHHFYFKDKALLSPYRTYETPLGNIDVDSETCKHLLNGKQSSSFATMAQSVDDEEHLFEMHLPFLVHRCQEEERPLPKIVPIMISYLSTKTREDVVEALLPYMADPQNAFVILSDFCHWGRRFGYTQYVPDNDLNGLVPYSKSSSHDVPIYQSIEYLDRSAMVIASAGSVAKWDAYIQATGNTICGQKPIGIVLRLLEVFKLNGGTTISDQTFEWLGYSQSGKSVRPSDSSVSYVSGFVRLSD